MDNLLNRIYPALRNFPKSEKFALAQDIKICFTKYFNYIKVLKINKHKLERY